MSHMVICPYCNNKFDRDKEKYVKIKRRYAHVNCAFENLKEDTFEIIDPTTIQKCFYCKKNLDTSKEEYVSISKTKIAHKHCYEEKEKNLTDEELLNRYIMKLLNIDYISPRIKKQIKTYIDDYNFTYSGILKALIYFYEIKGNSTEKANDGIGIVPYIYKDSYQYYYSLWLAKKSNENKNIKDYIPQEKKVLILKPKRKIRNKKRFVFLDNDDIEEDLNEF